MTTSTKTTKTSKSNVSHKKPEDLVRVAAGQYKMIRSHEEFGEDAEFTIQQVEGGGWTITAPDSQPFDVDDEGSPVSHPSRQAAYEALSS
jgi:hypothetical protein